MYASFDDIPVWQKAMNLAENVFGMTEARLRLNQIRRSALSVRGNIAEGLVGDILKTSSIFIHFRGSLVETKSHLIYGFNVGYFQKHEFTNMSVMIENIWQELNKLISSFTPPRP